MSIIKLSPEDNIFSISGRDSYTVYIFGFSSGLNFTIDLDRNVGIP